jgi:hypothetical protein
MTSTTIRPCSWAACLDLTLLVYLRGFVSLIIRAWPATWFWLFPEIAGQNIRWCMSSSPNIIPSGSLHSHDAGLHPGMPKFAVSLFFPSLDIENHQGGRLPGQAPTNHRPGSASIDTNSPLE